MDFTNTEISIADIPQVEQVQYQPLEKLYLRVKRISFFITFVLLAAALVAAFMLIEPLQMQWLITTVSIVYVLLAILVWVANTLNFRFSGYALREKDVLFRSGWFIQKTRMVPLNRIQHVSVQSGPIERSFGLASVSIFTAGAGQATIIAFKILMMLVVVNRSVDPFAQPVPAEIFGIQFPTEMP